jgi:hypothetical protein
VFDPVFWYDVGEYLVHLKWALDHIGGNYWEFVCLKIVKWHQYWLTKEVADRLLKWG